MHETLKNSHQNSFDPMYSMHDKMQIFCHSESSLSEKTLGGISTEGHEASYTDNIL